MFVAVDLPEAEHAKLAAHVTTARLDPRALRIADPEQWHITLAFYGDVTDPQAEELITRLDRAAERTPAFEIRLDRAGVFPANPHRAKVLWVGVAGEVEAMSRLADRCRAAGRRTGLSMPRERFHPHLTVARARHGAADVDRPLARLFRYDGTVWPVTSLRLIHSTLGSTVRHETVQEFRLLDWRE
jgi:2'-5' RNA ligase